MGTVEQDRSDLPAIGLDIGVFSSKGVLIKDGRIDYITVPTAGRPAEAAWGCLSALLGKELSGKARIGIMGQNGKLVAGIIGLQPVLEIEALQTGLESLQIGAEYVISLGHENMHYLELDEKGRIKFFNRNGQCAAGSGSFWYQQATRMGYNDRQLAEIAAEAETAVPISGRCAVFAKSDMTHAINEGATQSAVSAGMAAALVETVITGVALNRMQGPATLALSGGVANNKAVTKYLRAFAEKNGIKVIIPDKHEYINAVGAALKGTPIDLGTLNENVLKTPKFKTDQPLPPLDPGLVHYLENDQASPEFDLSRVYLGVDCGSVSTKCVLLDQQGEKIGGIYLPTTGRPALQVLQLIRHVADRYGKMLEGSPITVCTTGSGRFLSQKILNAEYAVDEITCQAEGLKYLFPDEQALAIIEIGGEDSKFVQLKEGILYDYNMNPVCAAGTGTFLENLAELLGVKIDGEFSQKAFQAEYAVDLGDICTLISQSILASASARGLPLNEQLASLAYSSAQNYLSKTVDKRPLEGKIVFAGATAKNSALAAALATICENEITVPAEPELTGALGCALMARQLYRKGKKGLYSFRNLSDIRKFTTDKRPCKADCIHEHNCILNIITFADGNRFIYGDRCGRFSGLERRSDHYELPDYCAERNGLLAGYENEKKETGPLVCMARSGLYYEYFPFWSAFFNKLGCRVSLSKYSTAETLEKGKVSLDSEMCYPMKVIVGHYAELLEGDCDYIFIPEVVDMEALPWTDLWPRSFVCPLLQTLRGTVVNSLDIDENRILYAQLNYRAGPRVIRDQLKPLAFEILGPDYSEARFEQALDSAYSALNEFRGELVAAAERALESLAGNTDNGAVVFLGRSYTLYDDYIAKKSMHYARESGLFSLPHEYLFYYMSAWMKGEIKSAFLDRYRQEFKDYLERHIEIMENIYPAQLQRMLSVVLLVNFLNLKNGETGLPRLNLIFLDPFKCGPNAMMRHYLSGLCSYLRLTIDEHTAAAGMITRLEAFKNTCLSNTSVRQIEMHSSKTCSVTDENWNKILIPEPTRHAAIFAALFRSAGVEAEVIPRSKTGDLSLARKYVNGEECLPFLQNLQDFLAYLKSEVVSEESRPVFFQGWACGPCRYGLYAPTQALAINRAGFGEMRVCAIKFSDVAKRFGYGFVLGFYSAVLTMDILYKLLHRVRPYETKKGEADQVFERYTNRLIEEAEKFRFRLAAFPKGRYRKPFETLIGEAAEEFARIERKSGVKPRILLNGEFYVRLDDRCNQSVIDKIEAAGGEVSLAPATELFAYTIHIDYLEAIHSFRINRRPGDYFKRIFYKQLIKVAHRDEAALHKAAGPLLRGLEEPSPEEIMQRAQKYVSPHYGGEPPMTIGRAAAFARRGKAAGAIFVAPFTCMPASVVEAQQGSLQEELGIPMVTVYYDGKENSNRDELVEGLVFQARQRIGAGKA